jgi:TetR/AcrR family transcriptional regulator, transcriptional repressor for nem operon
MARPREFNEKAVLEAAMQCFWARRYEVMSVRDLAEEMQITSTSLHSTFSDKRSLYRHAPAHDLQHGVHAPIGRALAFPGAGTGSG